MIEEFLASITRQLPIPEPPDSHTDLEFVDRQAIGIEPSEYDLELEIAPCLVLKGGYALKAHCPVGFANDALSKPAGQPAARSSSQGSERAHKVAIRERGQPSRDSELIGRDCDKRPEVSERKLNSEQHVGIKSGLPPH